ncbi:hypothetical protein CROQUDRAFT_100508 [Cronartium quercuum f. sp. fusiforme G11]|uniref:Uncharacterized protein n=1 Tax=Cronartium quercuum f. sp. fusiforme G11 TaxID=708437 RepID=A0A9P6N6Q7_9BASI|nr:hypothetical protein CROQUDRAFT_100508 [Cronartium quercuum f. sp. fusiforme G11]
MARSAENRPDPHSTIRLGRSLSPFRHQLIAFASGLIALLVCTGPTAHSFVVPGLGSASTAVPPRSIPL